MRLSHPDRVLYPQQGLTKRGLAEYYVEIADWILPHLAGRPLSLVRCPGGADKECFYQKHIGAGTGAGLATGDDRGEQGTGGLRGGRRPRAGFSTWCR